MSDWDTGWEHKAISRPLILCQLQIQYSYSLPGSPSFLIVHPILQATPFLDLTPSIPLPSAYFLANYNGPVSGIAKQFRESLRGLGIGDWEGHCVPSKDPHRPAHGPSVNNFGQTPSFIIGWIKVENKQGEDKGITIIYPSSLCLSYMPSSCPRPLDYIPELPTPLQPSPQVPPATPSIFSSLSPSDTGELSSFYAARLPIPVSPTCDSLRSFRTLTLSKSKDIRQAATEIGSYVDAVARDRERERERLRREREVGTSSSPKISRSVTSTSTSVSMPVEMDITNPAAPTVLPTNPSQHSAYPPAQSFYPSPPQINPTIVPGSDSKTSPVARTEALPLTETSSSCTPVEAQFNESAPTSAVSGTYDPFGNMDGAWSQSGASYLDADIDMDFGMDLDMGFNMNMNSMSGGGRSGAYNDRDGMDFEDAFTDDDFSFFDRPSRPSAVALPSAFSSTNFSQSHHSPDNAGPSLPVPASQMLLGNSPFSAMHGDVSKLPQYTPASHSSVWTPGVSTEESIHRQHDHPDFKLPELLPSSSAQTPESHSAPPTPNVILEFDPVIRRPTTSTGYSSPFEPIPFAQHHRAADHKYAQGKFSLSSSNEDDRAEFLFNYLPSSPNGSNGWRLRYDAVTDPRIGVVRKLIGVKRKTPFGHTERRSGKLSLWIRSHEDWELPNDEEGVDDQSELESEDGDVGDNESPLMSRPVTPPPAYLPLGPSLLHTQFHHSELLPLSVPLRPPGAAVAPTNLTASAPLPSVPTPVSPAVTMGAASEKSKSLEAAAFAIAAEVVENPLWAEAWRANTGPKDASDVWAADIRAVAELLEDAPNLEGLIDVASLFGLEISSARPHTFHPLEAPMITVGKGEAVIHILPPALHFWEKLGLGPKGGPKDILGYVLFEDGGEQRERQVESWLERTVAAYRGKHFGTLNPGPDCFVNGLVTLRYDSTFRKSLASFIGNLDLSERPVVVFIVLPATIMTLVSPILRQVLSFLSRTHFHTRKATLQQSDIYRYTMLHVAYHVTACGKWILAACTDERGEAYDLNVWLTQSPSEQEGETEISDEVYMVRKVWDFFMQFARRADTEWRLVISKLGTMKESEMHAWTEHLTTALELSIPPLHASIISVEPDAPWSFVTSRVNPSSPSRRTAQHRPSSSTKHQVILTDVSATTYAIFPTSQMPMSLAASYKNLGVSLSFVPEPPSPANPTSPAASPLFVNSIPASQYHNFNSDCVATLRTDQEPHRLAFIPRSTSTLIRIPNTPSQTSVSMLHIYLLHTLQSPHSSSVSLPDESKLHVAITRNFHDLAVLSKIRWNLDANPLLPFHLAAVDAMRISLDRDWDRLDGVVDS
ncbi:uncharacterized protein LACBIDRAFT_294897 [Laccaria bicolor S238N-H82]|uniref:Mediator of RNA polymerase II transcription subunit 13 n=1 Tax=Laccaria bicolor (strain S238N-H82 / ATCC MYA-4686) TaxID=486041 RepID=B0DK17_LACBS|nr:uncharacterized protein LACBIDRAFT_294897 [Laccaria bicolor S238N-H82]EDR04992.1 predicted protein [Laccaria bicolor S238N-H82]|eukprot:XP_001884382.1 predicted protein [Laccaria bicolor S238N-H82]